MSGTIRARGLRHRSADVERSIWHRLRDRRLKSFKFRRQHPVGPYIVDFACVEARLIIELDGSQHATTEADRDKQRDACLRANGWRVLRFWNNEVVDNIDGVLETIVADLKRR